MYKYFILIIRVFLIPLTTNAAWDGSTAGKVKQVDVAPLDGNNRGFRVVLEGNPALCNNENQWAYVNQSDDNYQVTVSALLAAKMSGTEVTIFTTINPSDGYCHMGYVILR